MNAPQQAGQLVYRDAPEQRELSDFERLLDKPWSPRAMLEDDALDRMMRMAKLLASSKLSVPDHLRGNEGDCLAIVTQAMLWNMNPFAVAQKTHLVNGKLGYEAQLVNAVLQQSGAVRGLPVYEYRDAAGGFDCRVGFIPRNGRDVVFGEWLNINAPTTKNSPLWKVNPRQQMGYLQVKNWARAFAPGAILGVQTIDDILDTEPGEFGAPNPDTGEIKPKGPQRRGKVAEQQAETPEADPPKTEHQPETRTEPQAETEKQTAAPEKRVPMSTKASTGATISGPQVAYLRNKIKQADQAEQTFIDRYNVAGIEHLSPEQFDQIKAELIRLLD